MGEALKEYGGAYRGHSGVTREQKDEIGSSAGAKKRHLDQREVTWKPQIPNPYIYYIHTPNLGLVITLLVWEREQGRFRASSKRVRREQGEARRE